MQHNILKENNITKIYLIYVDNGARKKIPVTLRFMDSKESYFATPTPVGFTKPKRKIPAELKVYTTGGIYQSKVTLFDTTMSLNEILYEVSIPAKWDFTQMRSSTRKEVELPLKIAYNDGFVIETKTYDVSLGGVSFVSDKTFSSIYKKISCNLTLELPKTAIINFPDCKMTVEAKFVRETETEAFETFVYSYKFCGLKFEDEEILKNFLLHLN